MGELQYAQMSGATCIFFYVQTIIGNQTNGEESFDSHPPFALTWTGTCNIVPCHAILPHVMDCGFVGMPSEVDSQIVDSHNVDSQPFLFCWHIKIYFWHGCQYFDS